jgi:MFS superfamily sulfate permease-like transporter
VLVLGPDSSVSPLIFAAVIPLAAGGDAATAVVLAGMLALLVGAIEIGLGVAKLGFVADLLSKEVQVGYMNGLAVTILVGQLPKLFGFSTDASGFIDEVRAFFTGLGDTSATTLVLGLATLAVLLLLPRLTQRVPAVLVAVVGATVATGALGLAPGSSCSARRSPTSTSPRPTCSRGSTVSSTLKTCTWRSSRCVPG